MHLHALQIYTHTHTHKTDLSGWVFTKTMLGKQYNFVKEERRNIIYNKNCELTCTDKKRKRKSSANYLYYQYRKWQKLSLSSNSIAQVSLFSSSILNQQRKFKSCKNSFSHNNYQLSIINILSNKHLPQLKIFLQPNLKMSNIKGKLGKNIWIIKNFILKKNRINCSW